MTTRSQGVDSSLLEIYSKGFNLGWSPKSSISRGNSSASADLRQEYLFTIMRHRLFIATTYG